VAELVDQSESKQIAIKGEGALRISGIHHRMIEGQPILTDFRCWRRPFPRLGGIARLF
jgi:hypothetical protein